MSFCLALIGLSVRVWRKQLGEPYIPISDIRGHVTAFMNMSVAESPCLRAVRMGPS